MKSFTTLSENALRVDFFGQSQFQLIISNKDSICQLIFTYDTYEGRMERLVLAAKAALEEIIQLSKKMLNIE